MVYYIEQEIPLWMIAVTNLLLYGLIIRVLTLSLFGRRSQYEEQ